MTGGNADDAAARRGACSPYGDLAASHRPAVHLGRAVRCWPYAVGVLLSIVLVAPFAVRENSWVEWANAYWLLRQQELHVRQSGLPSYFLSSGTTGIDYPIFVFYGGPVLTALAYVASFTSTWSAFVFSIFLAFLMGYTGMYWAGRAIGLRRLPATLLATIAVCVPYFVTDLYGRGAWAELLGVGATYLLCGGILRTLREMGGEHPRFTTLLGVTFGAAMLAGAHNISLLLGTVFVAVVVLIIGWSCLPRPLREMRARVVRRVVAPIVIGIGMCAAWLVPNLWFGGKTAIGSMPTVSMVETVNATRAFNTPSIVLWPLLRFPDAQRDLDQARYGTPPDVSLYNQTCSLLLIVISIGLVMFARRSRDRTCNDREQPRHLHFALPALSLACAGTLLLMVRPSWWGSFPRVALTVQFPMRLNPYLSGYLILLTAVVALVVGRRRAGYFAITTLIAVSAVWYGALAIYQAATTHASTFPTSPIATHEAIDAGGTPPTFQPEFFQTVQFRLLGLGVPVAEPGPMLSFDADGHLLADEAVGPGTYATNVVWSPLIRAEGAVIEGRDGDGFAVVRVNRARSPATVVPSIHASYPLPIALGIAGTVASLSLVAAAIALEAVRRSRRVLGHAPTMASCDHA